jgi:hypothetical protein
LLAVAARGYDYGIMDNPAVLAILLKNLAPIFAIIFTFGMPVAVVWTIKHFKLKHRELDLEAELHGKELDLRLRSLEARQAAVESALTAIGARPLPAPVEQRMSLLEGPASSEEAVEAKSADPLRLRSR